jgi:hypothetical protein
VPATSVLRVGLAIGGAAALAGAAVFAAAGVAACGGSGCGELCGPEGQFCHDDCTPRAIPQLTIRWEFNNGAARGFTGDSCTDLHVDRVAVELSSGEVVREAEEFCSFRQAVFFELPAGTYQVTLRPLSADDELLTVGPVTAEIEYGGTREEKEINVEPDAWARDYTGTFFFRVTWSGGDCMEATPAVAEQLLTLISRGRAVGMPTTEGDPVDGSAPAPCRSHLRPSPQAVLGVPFGPAVLTVVGLDDLGQESFEETFDTFVGAGPGNPELIFDVPSVLPDAGVPDAGPPDAGDPDAGDFDASL